MHSWGHAGLAVSDQMRRSQLMRSCPQLGIAASFLVGGWQCLVGFSVVAEELRLGEKDG